MHDCKDFYSLRLKLLIELPAKGHALLFFSGVYPMLVSDCRNGQNG